jgi:excisionase family DNA binding protein
VRIVTSRTDGSAGDWLSVHEASALVGVSPATLRRWSDAGEIVAFTTPGGHRRFARSAILAMLPNGHRTRPSTVEALLRFRQMLLVELVEYARLHEFDAAEATDLLVTTNTTFDQVLVEMLAGDDSDATAREATR